MPHSARENSRDLRWWATAHRIDSLLDIGAGSGTYANLLADIVPLMHGVEVWPDYVDRFDLPGKYHRVIVDDARLLPVSTEIGDHYDLVVFGDVLEHMTRAQALDVWDWAKSIATWGLISVPTVHWPQVAEHGNPHEAHVQEDLTVDDVEEDYGPFDYVFRYELTATFIRRLG